VEEALRRSEQRLQHAQRMAKICSWDFDIASGSIAWSDESGGIFGVDMREHGRTMADILPRIHPCDRARLDAEQRATAAGGPPLDNEHRILLPDGTLRWVRVLGEVTRDEQGRPIEISGAVLDITRQRETEMALRDANAFLEKRVQERTQELAIAKDRAESADRLKSAFLATMSHELRTPLNSIIGFTGIVLQRLAGPLTAEQNKQLGMVRSSARHLLSLINDVLDISKIEAGQLEIQAAPYDLAASVQKLTASMLPMAEQKALRLRLSAPTTLGTLVSDQRRVEQVLLNLLNNAVKFTEHGEVELSVECLEDHRLSNHAHPQPCVRFRVADTGIGIEENDLVNLFQPFRQIDTGLTRQHEGTGLGLAICGRLADLLRGEITVKSRFGTGSTFIFTIPRYAIPDGP
jgi:PAS domain S-box-containing protein